ncbi:MAG: hypothetical protein A2Y17_04705 [Clostridiales bacterium GWF2_38_85]|nr:MAG: hypothetical protein A2Y17_04705 [Clostridiales bacterium GWF2_38_85]HBL84412.1 hypothetical protein [Clostridiales bacterium]
MYFIVKKRLLIIILAALTTFMSACSGTPSSTESTVDDSSAAVESTVSEVLQEESSTYVFGEPVSSTLDINSGTFVKAEEVDSQYITKTAGGYTYLNIFSPVIDISGFASLEENNNQLYRMLLADKDKYSDNNDWLGWSTSGGRIRFRTNATSLQVDITLQNINGGMKHFAPSGVSGIDVYVGTGTARKYNCTILPKTEPSYSGTIYLPSGTKEVMIDLPLYAGVKSMSIGFPTGSTVAEPLPYTYEKPVVFYGSSITQGGCASRPGTAYFHVITRAFDANIVNLGFSGSALGETSIAEYIASIEMSAFVFDYDYNADTLEKLSPTHYPFYEIVRAAHPDIPIIFVSRANYSKYDTNAVQCRSLIIANYNKAKKAGDENVYFVDGSLFYDEYNPGDYTVDGLHPTDLGFRMMAEDIFPVLKEALEKVNN